MRLWLVHVQGNSRFFQQDPPRYVASGSERVRAMLRVLLATLVVAESPVAIPADGSGHLQSSAGTLSASVIDGPAPLHDMPTGRQGAATSTVISLVR
jgi:hypothetical protein